MDWIDDWDNHIVDLAYEAYVVTRHARRDTSAIAMESSHGLPMWIP